jgi:hypothetical protein
MNALPTYYEAPCRAERPVEGRNAAGPRLSRPQNALRSPARSLSAGAGMKSSRGASGRGGLRAFLALAAAAVAALAGGTAAAQTLAAVKAGFFAASTRACQASPMPTTAAPCREKKGAPPMSALSTLRQRAASAILGIGPRRQMCGVICAALSRGDPEAPDAGLSDRGSSGHFFLWPCKLFAVIDNATARSTVAQPMRCTGRPAYNGFPRAHIGWGYRFNPQVQGEGAERDWWWDSLDKQRRARAHGAFQIGNAASGDRREDETNGGSASGKGGNSRHRLGTSPRSPLIPVLTQ